MFPYLVVSIPESLVRKYRSEAKLWPSHFWITAHSKGSNIFEYSIHRISNHRISNLERTFRIFDASNIEPSNRFAPSNIEIFDRSNHSISNLFDDRISNLRIYSMDRTCRYSIGSNIEYRISNLEFEYSSNGSVTLLTIHPSIHPFRHEFHYSLYNPPNTKHL